MVIWHRRAGKDEIVLRAQRELALKDPGTYWHCFPEQKQARKAIWNGVDGKTGRRRIHEAFPEKIIKRMQDDDMFIELQNGATFQLIGSDRYDSTVGSGPKGIVYSEWALSNPAAWAYHQPMILESRGYAAFITTPRGNNHAKAMYDRAKDSPNWFCELLTVDDTGALSEAMLDEAFDELVDLWGEDMGRALYEQEYLCSFSGALIGAYWGAEVARMEREGRLKPVGIVKGEPVHTAWDLGKAVNNPIWCFQVINGKPIIVDFYVPETEDLADWCKWLDEQGYHGNDYVPHDILVTQWGTKRTRIEALRDHKRKPKPIPMVSVAEGLQAGRATINAAVFADNERVRSGIEGLRSYRREWDEELKTFRENPVKDWAEHIGSAFRYLSLAWRDAVTHKPVIAKPAELAYQVTAEGRIIGNMGIRDAVKARMKRKARNGRT